MDIKFLHAGCGDWVGLYIDNKLRMEGHSLDLFDVLKLILPDLKIVNIWSKDEYLDKYGNSCPQNWSEVDE